MKRYLVTSALLYANGPIHLGHVAGAYLPADLFCRYQRLNGNDVVFISGSDEFGVPIMLKARAENRSPQEVVDFYHAHIQKTFEDFGISYDFYGRTSDPIHAQTAQDFFRVLSEKDIFVQQKSEQLYDPEAGIFLADRFVRGTCPNCGYEDAYGDQCEKCGTSLSPEELLNPRSAITNAVPVKKETTHWYLPLDQLQPKLQAWIDTHPEWKKTVLGQVRSWLEAGLHPRAVTRDLPWGIPVPQDAVGTADVNGKVLYVWFDAPIGYISNTKAWAIAQGNPDLWKTYWFEKETQLVHFIGKDNIVFHCLIFPSMLMEHGDFVLPENVPANEFLNLEGQKLSTSRGWAVWLHEYLAAFEPDLLRYAIAGIFPENKDADFSWRDFQARVNGELADILGNFVNRALTFTSNTFDGKVPELQQPSAYDLEVLAQLAEFPAKIGKHYEEYRFRDAAFETMNLARLGNKYLGDTEPWKLRKTDLQACANVMHVSLQICASLGILLEPVMPFSAAKIRQMLNFSGVKSSVPSKGDAGNIGWADAGKSLLTAGHALGTPEILFKKVGDAQIDAQIEKLKQGTPPLSMNPVAEVSQPEYLPLKAEMVYDDFAKIDLRVGEIVVAERIPKADKLLRLEVDLGFERRQILSGIAEHFQPEALIGQKVVVVVNLAPRKMRGLESCGMILTAENPDGSLALLSTTGENGAEVR